MKKINFDIPDIVKVIIAIILISLWTLLMCNVINNDTKEDMYIQYNNELIDQDLK